MKNLFLLVLGILIAIFPFSIRKLIHRNDAIYRRMFNVFLPAFISALSHGIVLITSSQTLALVAYSFYFISANWIAVAILAFCVYYAESRINIKIFHIVILPLAFADSISVFLNIFIPFMFSVNASVYRAEEIFNYSPTGFFLIHTAFCYSLYFYCCLILISKLIKEPPTLRIKYSSLLFFVSLITISNFLYIYLEIPFNLSVIIYAFSFIGAHYVITKTLPERLIQKTLGLISDKHKNGIVLLDVNGKCVYINAFVRENFECSEQNVLALDIFSDYFALRKDSRVSGNESFAGEVYFQSYRKRLSLLITDFIIQERETVIGRYYLIEDITESKNQVYAEKMFRTRDPLTGLFNKDYFFEKVEHRLKFDRFTKYYLLVSDIVNFKLINDLHGKPFGDTILVRIADSIRRNAAPDVIYGRLYNDHFIMLVTRRSFDEDVYKHAFKSDMEYLKNFSYNIIIHMGVYEIEDSSLPVSVMCDRAFLALKTIKNDYKNGFAYYDDKLRLEVLKMQMLMNELPQALNLGQIKMYLQPQVTVDGKLIGAEALVRWHHPQRGIIPPGEFVEAIEKINIISDVDRYIWECACEKLSEWKKEGRTDLSISVNISARDFVTMDLYETFVNLVNEYDISPRNLNLEITETAVLFDLENQTKLLDRLRSAGFIVEMDDFGSGYSSLNMLKDITVDVLKIDMAFLQESKNDEKSHKILEKIIILAKDLGMKVLTEGVETEVQIDFLSAAGCDLFQGFYFSRPISVDVFEEKYFNQREIQNEK